MNSYFLFLLLVSISFAKYNYSDKCYRYLYGESDTRKGYYQYYVSKDGSLLSQDEIIHEYTRNGSPTLAVQYYYHNVLSDCKQTDTGFKCTCTIESAWFKIINAEAAKEFVTSCDPVFYKKYGDVTKHNCDKDGNDPFMNLKFSIGQHYYINILMQNGIPVPELDQKEDGDCIWEYDILGLWSIVAIVVLVSCIVVALMFIGVIWFIVQKHRSNQRKRLDNALISDKETHVELGSR